MIERMNVAIPISRFDSSGGIRVLTVLANGLARRSFNVTFVVPSGGHHPIFSLDENVRVHLLKRDFGKSIVGGLCKKAQLVFGIPENSDAVIANAFMTAYSVKAAKLFGSYRALYFVQHYEPLAFGEFAAGNHLTKVIKTWSAKLTYHLKLECVTNSQWTARMLLEKHGVNSVVVPLGVDRKVFCPQRSNLPSEDQIPTIMAIGNANPIKRFDLFAETAELLHQRMKCKFLVATHDPSLFRLSKVHSEIVSPANDVQMAALYNRASFFISTSAFEGFGLPLLEAMACGIPVITSDSGGIHDFCQNESNCLIVDPARAESLAAAVERLHHDRDLKARLIQNGLQTATRWPWENLINAFDNILRNKGRG